LALASRNGFPAMYMDIGKRLTETCCEMYRRMPTGLSPEIVYFNTLPEATDDMFVKVCKAKQKIWYRCAQVCSVQVQVIASVLRYYVVCSVYSCTCVRYVMYRNYFHFP